MTAPLIKQLPLHFGNAPKTTVRTQFAALCYRIKSNKVQVLLVTTRRTGRWILPKGWPIDGLTPQKSAAREAWEEAGVIGRPDAQPLRHALAVGLVDDDHDARKPGFHVVVQSENVLKLRLLLLQLEQRAHGLRPRKADHVVRPRRTHLDVHNRQHRAPPNGLRAVRLCALRAGRERERA